MLAAQSDENGRTMDSDEKAVRRVRFYGAQDMAAGFHIQRVSEIVEQFDPAEVPATITDAIELHHVLAYLENRIFPRAYSAKQVQAAEARVPQLRSIIGRFFSKIDDTNVASIVTGVDFEYHIALVKLLGRNKAFERCDASTMLPALSATDVSLGTLLSSKKLVRAYDSEVRDDLLAEPRNAEFLVRKFLQDNAQEEVHVPPSFTPADSRALMDGYLDCPDANLNYVGLIEFAPVDKVSAVDPKLKLKAKQRKAQMTGEFFKSNTGIRTGAEVSVSDAQVEPVKVELDGMFSQITFSRRWLDDTNDFPSVLNNFHHVVGICDLDGILTLPAYPAEFGVLERTLGMNGKTDYRTGAVFQATDVNTLLQTRLLQSYLRSKDIDLEEVIAWFFEKYLADEFGAANFSFTPCGSGTSYLQKVRHLFSEMESVVKQFSLYVQEGELDRELLAMTSEQVRYKEIPTLLDGKYLYATEHDEIVSILHLLFSDQSLLNYINEDLKDDNAARLLLKNQVAYSDFEVYQQPGLDHLLSLGVLKNTGARLEFTNHEQLGILLALHMKQATNYFRLSVDGRAEADAMVGRGWATKNSSLVTEAEGRYLNYFLNNFEFTNGPQLRNKYAHGSQPHAADSEDAHFRVYLIALRLILALVIKMNDDFCLACEEAAASKGKE